MSAFIFSNAEIIRTQEIARETYEQSVAHTVEFYVCNELGLDDDAEFHFEQAKRAQHAAKEWYKDAKNMKEAMSK